MRNINKIAIACAYIAGLHSIPAYADVAGSDFDYLDCSVSLSNIKFNINDTTEMNFLIDKKLNKLKQYSEIENIYLEQCATFCDVGKDEITVAMLRKMNGSDVQIAYIINRWSGALVGKATAKLNQNDELQFDITGDCKSGSSKVKSKPKF